MKPQPQGGRLATAQGGRDRRKHKAAQALTDGQLHEAVQQLKPLCRKASQDPEVWLMLASAQGQLGDFQGTIDACRRALAINSGLASAWSFMGNAQAGLGQLEEAQESYRKALALNPRDPGACNNLGNALAMAGEDDAAIGRFREALRLNPNSVEALNNLGRLLKDRGELDEATRHLEKAVELGTRRVESHRFLGDLLAATGTLERAEKVYKQARNLFPDDFPLHRGFARVLRYQGRFREALEAYEGYERIYGSSPASVAGRAEIHEFMGEGDKAYELIRGVIDAGHDIPPTLPEVYLRICRKHGDCQEAISLAEAYLTDPGLDSGQRESLHFAVGKLLDKLGRYDEAFEHFRQGNELTVYKYDPDEQTAFFDAIVSIFSREGLASLPRASNASQRPVFIVGMPRSGTSLCEQILASHPDVCGAGELAHLNHLTAVCDAWTGHEYPSSVPSLSNSQVDELADWYLARLNEHSTAAARVTDKMPQNFRHLGLIQLLFPGARIIHCTRSPLDTCLSIYTQNFNATHNYATDLANLGHYYRGYQRVMTHWAEVLDVPMLTVSYEELVSGQERMTRQMVEFIGLPWDERCLQFHEAKRNIATASYEQVRQQLYSSAVERWRNYEGHLGPLRDALGI